MPLSQGEPAPWFKAATPSNPDFVFDTVAGRYVLLAFLPSGEAELAAQQIVADDDELESAIRTAMWGKWSGHRINHADFVQPARSMSMIGG